MSKFARLSIFVLYVHATPKRIYSQRTNYKISTAYSNRFVRTRINYSPILLRLLFPKNITYVNAIGFSQASQQNLLSRNVFTISNIPTSSTEKKTSTPKQSIFSLREVIKNYFFPFRELEASESFEEAARMGNMYCYKTIAKFDEELGIAAKQVIEYMTYIAKREQDKELDELTLSRYFVDWFDNTKAIWNSSFDSLVKGKKIKATGEIGEQRDDKKDIEIAIRNINVMIVMGQKLYKK